MRALTIVVAVAAIGGFATNAFAGGKVRLAQTSTTTNCMMACNVQQANCQAECVVPGTPSTGAATATGNANTTTSCILSCTNQQLACQTDCARISPSQ